MSYYMGLFLNFFFVHENIEFLKEKKIIPYSNEF